MIEFLRVLAYIWLPITSSTATDSSSVLKEIESKLFNYVLVLKGYANVMTVPPNVKYQDFFLQAEKKARENNIGLWGLSSTSTSKPSQTSTQSSTQSHPQTSNTQLQIVGVKYDGKNEYVLIKNTGSVEVNLSGWTLRSVSGNQTFKFPSIVLKPGQTISVHSGLEASGGLIWTTKYMWNNDGDEALLISSSGKIVSRYKY